MRAEDLKAKAIEAEEAERLRAEAEAAATAAAATAKAEAEERRRAEKAAFDAKIAAQKNASGIGGKAKPEVRSESRISKAEMQAKARRDAEMEYLSLKKRWETKPRRQWRRHDSWRYGNQMQSITPKTRARSSRQPG